MLTKTDLLPHVPFDPDQCVAWARAVNPRLAVLRVSARRGNGIAEWCAWLERYARAA